MGRSFFRAVLKKLKFFVCFFGFFSNTFVCKYSITRVIHFLKISIFRGGLRACIPKINAQLEARHSVGALCV